VKAGAGCEVPRCRDRHESTARQSGCRGMDDMPVPRAAMPHVNARCGAPNRDDVPCNPRGYTPKGRVPVFTHFVPRTSRDA